MDAWLAVFITMAMLNNCGLLARVYLGVLQLNSRLVLSMLFTNGGHLQTLLSPLPSARALEAEAKGAGTKSCTC